MKAGAQWKLRVPDVGTVACRGKARPGQARLLASTNAHWQPDRRHAGRRLRGKFRRPRPTCHFTSARKLGVGSVPMSACLDAKAAAPGVPAAAPRMAGDWRVTCAVY